MYGSSLLNGLIAYWSLNQSSGVRYSHNGRNDLTDNNTVTGSAGKVGTASQFTAANTEYLSLADNADLSTGDIEFTFALWTMLDSKSTYRMIIQKAGATAPVSNNEIAYRMIYDFDVDRFVFLAGNNSANGSVAANTLGSPATATWYFIVFWHEPVANVLRIQINNGAIDTTSYSSGSYDSAGPFYIGRQEAAFYHDGRANGVHFYKRLLSVTEKSMLYNNGNGLAYPFDDPTRGVRDRRTRMVGQLSNMLQPV